MIAKISLLLKRSLRQLVWVRFVLVGLLLWGGLLAEQGFGQLPAPLNAQSSEFALPVAQVHPLPLALQQWQDVNQQGDYFEFVETSTAGYLIWSEFPVQVYIEPANSGEGELQWAEAVGQAMQEWSRFLPLAFTDRPAEADIAIWCSAPPIQQLQPATRPDQPLIERLPRIRAAETRYQIDIQQSAHASSPILGHRFTIYLSPNQSVNYTKATARHELGHALGIWGHSPDATDALYFSQVQASPAISARDINTLKRIYQQPTHLGWTLQGH